MSQRKINFRGKALGLIIRRGTLESLIKRGYTKFNKWGSLNKRRGGGGKFLKIYQPGRGEGNFIWYVNLNMAQKTRFMI